MQPQKRLHTVREEQRLYHKFKMNVVNLTAKQSYPPCSRIGQQICKKRQICLKFRINYIPLLLCYKIKLNIMNLSVKPSNSQKAADIFDISNELYTAFVIL